MGFKRITLPMIRRVMPGTIAESLVGVQPMTSPAGDIFALKFSGSDTGPMFGSFVKEIFTMMNIRQRSVNVARTELLTKLRENLEIHKSEYAEALVECHRKLLQDLEDAAKKVGKIENPEKLRGFSFNFRFPQNHAKDYEEVIEMLEMSVDEVINLDAESFKAYYKNEWSWSSGFNQTKALYAQVGNSFSDFSE